MMSSFSGLLLAAIAMLAMGRSITPTDPAVEESPKEVEYTKQPHHFNLWSKVKVRSSWEGRISRTVHRINMHKKEYKVASAETGVPWKIIAALHNMESTGSFRRHLHEGSSLSRRTRHVPKGRPKVGDPPFTWQDSAYDVLYRMKRMDRHNWSDIGEALYQCERYNGTGYLRYHKNVNSPYLWSGTYHYDKGKYVSDGKWSKSARSSQVGVAPILISLKY